MSCGDIDLGSSELQACLQQVVGKTKNILERQFACRVEFISDQGFSLINCQPLHERDQKLLQQILRGMSRELLQIQKRYLELATIERELEQTLGQSRMGMNNVLSLQQFRHHKKVTSESPHIYFAVSCFVEGANPVDRRNLAFELHMASRRFAFIPFFDLDREVKTSAQQLCEMGAITLYISDIEHLSNSEQDALLAYCRGIRTSQTPHLIASSAFNYGELVRRARVSTALLDHLTTSVIRLDKPLNQYVESGVVPFLYHSLLDRSLEKDS